ncbi:hypothetical protein A2422_02285 [Candidatus Woesebacteria bacterium RIFOXYC1_FULL_31_51]|uniref:Glycosyl transferase family 1 n=1 Tax=Candidatus Woesebacteria bacterium GW2011_GWC2_31_9 TaxID=1618586 RepID=A0A0G0BJW0_9BACT|nr:MAG: group 1 glycosyl transferase [Candidatus Woesebacteria bacterium GW2011_GWF1_31_35]KKP23541.1 MAG: glycosyl transferase family 1 [Candidatus Woesebacteria bacterium GW2011_GWC1_30_29]KKP25719.1 MAG: glycosyl transferase family 1 [Candidatus Woesebacteria bacterium GW2011_GWD1_31_12]KKP27817.1 MAG: glycosyl transferase family 1 [Candidatus Woesebacteria bacterium GW2011_GWB1_31_29]KKP31342.1 MAG: glycosyl transferase family 1 [Candidatus Woesebacteria bacterium GW2011_GWC2_31_9]KKP33077
MKIAFLNKYQNKVNRGAETYVLELSKRFSKNHKVDVISDVNYFSLLKNDYDLIIPTNGRLQAILVRIITWLKRSKVVISGQSGKGLDDRINLCTFPNYFVALSSKALNWARKVNPFVKLVYIPNGVDINKFKPEGEKFKTNLKSPIILSVGAFTEQKRHGLVIDAVSKLDNVSLIIAGGGGNLKDELEIKGNKLLGSNRFQIIEMPYEKMPEVYRSVNLFTLASTPTESFGNVIVEAMATNLPVVVTNDPIRKEISGDAGLFADPEDIDSYSKELEKALSLNWEDKPRKQAEKFDWDKITKKYEEILTNL